MRNSSSDLLSILTGRLAFLLYWHLSNENNLDWYGIETRCNADVRFRWNFTTMPHVAILAALRTIANLASPGQRLSFVPFCCNTWRYRSRWAALRISPTNGDAETIRRRALAAFCRAQELAPRMCTILEFTGADTWHVWAIANGYRSWDDWTALLVEVISGANLNDPLVQYDLFPSPAALLKPRMLGLRAPGSWNPATNTVAEIHHHNLCRFLPLLTRRHEGWLVKGVR